MAIKENAKNNLLAKIVSRPHLADFLWIFSFSILTAVAAQITVPVEPVPFTLQTMIVLLSGAFLGAKKGAYSQIVYLVLGVIGFPVFAQIPDATIGIARLFGPTGGYLLSFPLAAFVAGYLVEKNKGYINFVFSMFIANVLILLIGSVYLGIFFLGNVLKGLEAGAVVFLFWEVVKVFAAAGIYFGISKKYKKIY
jgi:biotin transport system substrate-specific component